MMPRYIDANALKKQIKKSAEVVTDSWSAGNWYAISVSKVITLVEDAPTADLVEAVRWIPVSERLPEANGRYLVTRGLNACGSLWNRIYIANYSDLMGIISERVWWQGNVGKSDFERIDDVFAWMPLPEPYKKEKNDGEIH